jgi:phage terminase large subunit-like protein
VTVDPVKLRELAASLEVLNQRQLENRLAHYRPYAKQAEFHRLGATFRERLLTSGNQQGKTFCGAMEAAAHLTGDYPEWWEGKRFNGPTRGWAAGVTGESTRDTTQRLLVGALGQRGTGAIPAAAIMEIRAGRGVGDTVDTVLVKHRSGRDSQLSFKSYEKGREKWQGETLDFVWYDEEPPADIYGEGLARIAARAGIVWMTFTPLLGMSDVVRRFFSEHSPDRALVQMTIDDAEHIAPEERKRIEAGYAEHEREARVRGVPMLGSGRIYPIAESVICTPPVGIPQHWARIVGLDFGYQNFAAVSLAWDRDSDTVYVVDAYKSKEETPIIHAATIKTRFGDWLPCAWPQDALQHDKGSGLALHAIYKAQGLRMIDQHAQFENGSTSVEAGIMDLLDRMRTGRFRVFEHLAPWLEEFRTYHRKDGRIVKEHDHLLDATRYGVMMLRRAANGPSRNRRGQARSADGADSSYSWVWGDGNTESSGGGRAVRPGRKDFYSNPFGLG